MTEINIRLMNEFVYLARGNAAPVQVERVDTATRSYFLTWARAGDAIRTSTPVLEVESVKVEGDECASQIKLSGRVTGHPEETFDKKIITTSTVTAFHLKGGEIIKTEYGQQDRFAGARLVRAVREVVDWHRGGPN